MRAQRRGICVSSRVRVALVILTGGGGSRTIGEECNRWFIDEAWVSECRLLAENAGALSPAAEAAHGEKGRSGGLLQINFCRDAFQPVFNGDTARTGTDFIFHGPRGHFGLNNYLPCKS